jgi:hypothetical protein
MDSPRTGSTGRPKSGRLAVRDDRDQPRHALPPLVGGG